ncbi:MAG TPA: deaminase [Candidatus Sulfotelmatobacter sp.]|nr:deaminase [Candidatus Sulfotelmatobacter sp.]
MAAPVIEQQPVRRELIFGLVAPLGVDKNKVIEAFKTCVKDARYDFVRIDTTEIIEEYRNRPKPHAESYLERKEALMDAGDEMRADWASHGDRRGDAVAIAAVFAIHEHRDSTSRSSPTMAAGDARCYLIDSLKHPHELETLRSLYGPAFIAIALYAPPAKRREFLLLRARGQERAVDALLDRDARAPDDLGQRASDAFYVCDFIVDATKDEYQIERSLKRLFRLLFGDPHVTPTKQEMGMFLARAAQARSGSLARQIGAAILRDDGSVVSVGTNEVAKPITGGQYWAADDKRYHGRDRSYRLRDTSDEFRAEMVADALQRLAGSGALNDYYAALDPTDRLNELYFARSAPLRKSKIKDNIDYIRAVHAEGAAIIDAARAGVATKGTTMYATVFPCHECARHIVAAGIKKVVYLAPYPKSGVSRLYEDSIQVDPDVRSRHKVLFRTFRGVAPPRYLDLFTVGEDERKGPDGSPKTVDIETAAPQLPYFTPDAGEVVFDEARLLAKYADSLRARRLL